MLRLRFCIVVLVVSFLVTGPAVPVIAAGEVKIGYVENLTGQQATLGQYDLAGVQMAVDDLNAAGGIDGQKVVLVMADARSETTAAVNALKKILAENKDIAALIVPPYTSITLAMEPLIREVGIPAFTGGTNVTLTRMGNKWMFRNRPDDSTVAQAMATFAVEELHAKNIAIFHNTDSFGSGGANILQEYLKSKYNITPVAVAGHNTGDRDFSATLMNFRSKGADTILSYSFPMESGLLTRQIMQTGFKVKLVGSPAMASADTLQLTGSASEGVYSVGDTIPVTDMHPNPKTVAWAKKYHAKAGVYSDYGAAYYDTVMLIAEAVKKAKSTNREEIRAALHTIKNFEGYAQTFTIDQNGDGVHSATVVIIKNGKPEPVKKISLN
jgi:branched-chain amino acid transport system substrate-binding protein